MQRSAYIVSSAGSLDRLKLRQDHLPELQSGDVRVRVEAIGLNFADIFAIKGLYSATPSGEFIPGLEFSGIVSAVGSAVTHFKSGDRVMGVSRFGAYATALHVPEAQLLALPENWSFAEGAAYPVQAATAAYGLLSLGQLKAGHTVLIHSAAGGVGLWANRIARALGAVTIGTVGSEAKIALLEKEKYALALLRDRNWADVVREAYPSGVDRVLESIGGKVFQESYDLLAPEGRILVFGASSYQNRSSRPNWLRLARQYLTRPRLDPLSMIPENRSVMAFNLIWLFDRIGTLQELLLSLSKLSLDKPIIDQYFEFDELPAALNYFQAGLNQGKIVVMVNSV